MTVFGGHSLILAQTVFVVPCLQPVLSMLCTEKLGRRDFSVSEAYNPV